jgi:acetamidase/formamidase
LGDSHAAQGDGEVCGTAIETSSRVTLRVHVQKQVRLNAPRLESPSSTCRRGAAWVTTGIGPDLREGARAATLDMIRWIQDLAGLGPEDAYLLTSTAADLTISEIVDAPNWVVTMHLPKTILGGGTL